MIGDVHMMIAIPPKCVVSQEVGHIKRADRGLPEATQPRIGDGICSPRSSPSGELHSIHMAYCWNYRTMRAMSSEHTMQVSLRLFLAIFLFTAPGVAEQASGALGMDEERIVKGMDDYGLTGRQKTYEALGQTAAPSLTPMLPWIEKRLGLVEQDTENKPPVQTLEESFAVVLREDEERKLFEGYTLGIRLAPTIEQAGRLVVHHFQNISVSFTKGSFSGLAVGDWTARFEWGPSVDLLFTRRNAYVHLVCDPAKEISKQTKASRWLPDPLVKHPCEELARDIDAQIEKLPGTER